MKIHLNQVKPIARLRHDKFITIDKINNRVKQQQIAKSINNIRYGDNHAKRRENFEFTKPREDNNFPIKYMYSEKKRHMATIKVTLNIQESKQYVPIFKNGTEEELFHRFQYFKRLLVNYPTILETVQ